MKGRDATGDNAWRATSSGTFHGLLLILQEVNNDVSSSKMCIEKAGLSTEWRAGKERDKGQKRWW